MGDDRAAVDPVAGRETDERLRKAEARLRVAQEVARIGTFEWNIRDDVNTWSPEIERLYGLEEGSFGGTYEAWAALVHPDDLPAAEARVRESLENGAFQTEWRVVRPDGGVIWVEARGVVEKDAAGEPLRMFGANIDVTERKAAEEGLRRSEARARALLSELQHRVRNSLSVVRSIARRSVETNESVEELGMHLDGRIGAFARVQSALARDPAAGVDLAGMVADELAAATAHEGQRLVLEGPDVKLPSKVAENLGLAIHELATNAIKYGALSTGGGRIRVAWTMSEGEPQELLLQWKETGVRLPASGPTRRGFGTELIERMLPYQLGARTELAFEPDGLRCNIEVTLGG